MSFFKVDMNFFEDLNYRLAALQEHFGPHAPRSSKDPLVQRLIIEARLHAFSLCHASLRELLLMMYKESHLSKEEGNNSENALGAVLSWMHQNRMISREELLDFIEQFDAALLLSYDREWLDTAEGQKMFDARCAKLSRYYYRMSSFSGMLSQRLTVSSQEAQHVNP